MSERMGGKVALVTGAASGLGQAITARFITGHTLVIDSGQTAGDGRLLRSYPPPAGLEAR